MKITRNSFHLFLSVEIWFLKETIQYKNDLIKSLLLPKSFNGNKHFPLVSQSKLINYITSNNLKETPKGYFHSNNVSGYNVDNILNKPS